MRRPTVGALVLFAGLLATLPLNAQGQVFNNEIQRVFIDGNNNSCGAAGLAPIPGSDLERLCGTTGVNLAGASNSTASSPLNNVSAVPAERAQMLLGPLNMYISADYEHFDKDVTTFEPG